MEDEFTQKIGEVAKWLSDATSTKCGPSIHCGHPAIKIRMTVVFFRSSTLNGGIVEVFAVPPSVLSGHLRAEIPLIQRQSLSRVGAHKIGARILRQLRRAFGPAIERVLGEVEAARV